jgi:predicted RNase H-like HicB family nuclease
VKPTYAAIVQEREKWWIGWIAEVPGVSSQGETREDLLDNLSSALREALEMNRSDAIAAAHGPFEEVGITPA